MRHDYDDAYDRLEALGEARELEGDLDAADDAFWQPPLHPRDHFSEIIDNLSMGGGPWNPLALPGAFVAVLDIKPSTSYIYWDDTEIREVQMHDSWDQPLDGVDELARWVNEKRENGRVLVKCAAGLNRSGVVVARALMLGPEQLTGQQAVDLIHEKRDPLALCNLVFKEWILAQS
jgi:protein-tyrosine phosphatase